MCVLSDRDIRSLLSSGRLRVEPLFEDTVRENGLDLRLSGGYCVLADTEYAYVDAWRMEARVMVFQGETVRFEAGELSRLYRCYEAGDTINVPRRGRLLLSTVERVCLPPDVVGFVNLRSSLARLGLSIPPTIVDAGFCGQLTIELVGSSFPVRLRPGMRFLHLVLARTCTPAGKPYSGKYQGQKGVTLPKPDTLPG